MSNIEQILFDDFKTLFPLETNKSPLKKDGSLDIQIPPENVCIKHVLPGGSNRQILSSSQIFGSPRVGYWEGEEFTADPTETQLSHLITNCPP